MRLALALIAMTASAPALAEPVRYELDPEHTTISFLVDHIGYARTLGVFLDMEGGFVYDEATQQLSDVDVVVRAESVETFHDGRDDHVRNADFLNVSAFPEIRFTADGGTPESANRGSVDGTLTLLGESRPLRLDVTLNKAAEYPFGHGRHTLGLSIQGSLMRSEWGMTYAVDNGLVGDEVTLMIETEAMRVE